MTDSASFVVPIVHLQWAAGFVAHAASRDASLPILAAVRVSWGPQTHMSGEGDPTTVAGISFTATDRFRLAVATIPQSHVFTGPEYDLAPVATMGDPGSILVDAKRLGEVVKSLPKPNLRAVPNHPSRYVTLKVSDGMLWVQHGATMTQALAPVDGTFPNVDTLIAGSAPNEAGAVALNPGYAGDALKAGALISAKSAAVRMFLCGPKTVFVSGEDGGVRGTEIVMQVRLPDACRWQDMKGRRQGSAA